MSKITRLKTLLSVVASLTSLTLLAASHQQPPKLLLNIVVEGLDEQCLEMLMQSMGNGGFRMLQEKGLYLPQTDYGSYLDAPAAASEIMTGAAPAVNGVAAEYAYDPVARRVEHIFADPATLGNFTADGFSPSALRVSNLTDEVRIATGGTAFTYSVAANPAVAIAMGGHAVNGAMWLDPKTANWASSTYYRDFPVTVSARNRAMPLINRLDTMTWTGSPELARISWLPDYLSQFSFRHVFPRSKPERIDMFLNSPLVNKEITDVALDLIGTQRLGRHGTTDVLNIAYTLNPYTYGRNPDNRPELYDAYLKLDSRLEQLFKAVDKHVGMDSTVVMLAATPPRPGSRRDDEQWNIPYGEFSTRKALSLLNMYLMALYGNGEYVAGYHNGQFYLNRDFIKEKGLDLRTIRTEAADFLTRMTGIDRVYTLDDIIAGRAGEKPEVRRRNSVHSSAGDLAFDLVPGFELVDDHTVLGAESTGNIYRMAPATAPAFIMAPGVQAQTIGTPVDARILAPTVASVLRIRAPNAASLPPLKPLR